MALAARLDNYFDAEARRARSKHRLRLRFADSLEDLRAAQRLRHRVFVEEMGARLSLTEPGIDATASISIASTCWSGTGTAAWQSAAVAC